MGQKAMAVAGVCSCNGHENSKEDSLEYYGRYLGGRRSKLLQRLPPFKLEKFLLFNLFYLFSHSTVLPFRRSASSASSATSNTWKNIYMLFSHISPLLNHTAFYSFNPTHSMTYTSTFLIYHFFRPQSPVKQCPRMALIDIQDCYNVLL